MPGRVQHSGHPDSQPLVEFLPLLVDVVAKLGLQCRSQRLLQLFFIQVIVLRTSTATKKGEVSFCAPHLNLVRSRAAKPYVARCCPVARNTFEPAAFSELDASQSTLRYPKISKQAPKGHEWMVIIELSLPLRQSFTRRCRGTALHAMYLTQQLCSHIVMASRAGASSRQ